MVPSYSSFFSDYAAERRIPHAVLPGIRPYACPAIAHLRSSR
jgi:hypothetical protein